MSIEKPSQKPPLKDADLDQRAAEERESRGERIERLKAAVDRLFSGEQAEALRAKIVASFNVPQWGEYHNEGVFMDTHLDLILDQLKNVRAGEMSEFLPADVRETLQETATAHEAALEKYVFLHDISKMDCLLIKAKGPDGKAKSEKLTWEEWRSRVPAEVQGDPVAMRAWLKSSGIESISYYHPSDKASEGKKHGEEGAEEAKRLGVEIDPSVLVAIANHEVAYQFAKPNAGTYRKYFGEMSDAERAMALTASYTDTAASLGKNGESDLGNFLALTVSRRNDAFLRAVEATLQSVSGLDPKKVEKRLGDLRKAEYPFPEADATQLLETIRRECRPTEYDVESLSQALADVVKSGKITEDDQNRILDLVRSGKAEEIGRSFGPKMKFISSALKTAEKKT